MEMREGVRRRIREALRRSDYSLEALVEVIRAVPDQVGPASEVRTPGLDYALDSDGAPGRASAALDGDYADIFDAALPMLNTRDNDLHALIGLRYVLEMLDREGGDPGIAVPAILLHDLGWSEIREAEQRKAYGPGSADSELNRLHETAGARLAGEVLEARNYPDALAREICRIIETHDSRPSAQTLEEAIVKDADKVWRVSGLGFPLTLNLLGNLTPQELHDFIAVRVPRWFLTTSGRDLARGELRARREEYGLQTAPDVPPPPGYGIGDAGEYE